MVKLIADNWQRFLFAIVGLLFLYYSIEFLRAAKVPEASGVFAIAFLCFLYSNLSRFKKFKGLGFEAELWEDKQKEAADLIDRLKNVVAIYTSEIVMSSVKRGRWGDGVQWKANWKLYDELVNQHDVLGQKIDFSDLKKQMDDYFLFDMCHHIGGPQQAIVNGERHARDVISKEFGSPVRDMAGYSRRIEQINEIENHIQDALKASESGNLAELMLQQAQKSKTKLKTYFDIDVTFDEEDIERLSKISELYKNRPVKITDELISWADSQ